MSGPESFEAVAAAIPHQRQVGDQVMRVTMIPPVDPEVIRAEAGISDVTGYKPMQDVFITGMTSIGPYQYFAGRRAMRNDINDILQQPQ
jgi:hypothetical protein